MCFRSFLLGDLGWYRGADQINNPHVLALSESNQEVRCVSSTGKAESRCSPPAHPPLTGAHSQHPGGTQWWGAVWAHLSDPAPWGAAAEVGICPGCFGTLGGM